MEVQTHTEPWDLNTMICFVAYRLRQECNQRLAEYGLTYAQARILNHLHMAQDDTVVNQHNLVCSLGVKASSISAVLRNMEHKGLIKKVRMQSDNRNKEIQLTPLGDSLHTAFHTVLTEVERKITANISPAQKKAMCQCLQMFCYNLQTKNRKSHPASVR